MKKKPTKRRWTNKTKDSGKKSPPAQQLTDPQEAIGMRLNKYVAYCGICSRREAAELVKSGQVMVNDKVLDNPAYQYQEGDVVKYKGRIIQPEVRKVYILLNKPRGVITTASDERGRKTVMDIVKPKVKERIFPVGRPDRDTTGLLLLTNDGDLAQKLAHPRHNTKKVYHTFLDKEVPDADLEKIRNTLELEDGPAPVDEVGRVTGHGKQAVALEIHIGRNRIVRRIFEHLGYDVERLDRVYFAGLTKKDLPRGFFRPLTEREVIMLKHFV